MWGIDLHISGEVPGRGSEAPDSSKTPFKEHFLVGGGGGSEFSLASGSHGVMLGHGIFLVLHLATSADSKAACDSAEGPEYALLSIQRSYQNVDLG